MKAQRQRRRQQRMTFKRHTDASQREIQEMSRGRDLDDDVYALSRAICNDIDDEIWGMSLSRAGGIVPFEQTSTTVLIRERILARQRQQLAESSHRALQGDHCQLDYPFRLGHLGMPFAPRPSFSVHQSSASSSPPSSDETSQISRRSSKVDLNISERTNDYKEDATIEVLSDSDDAMDDAIDVCGIDAAVNERNRETESSGKAKEKKIESIILKEANPEMSKDAKGEVLRILKAVLPPQSIVYHSPKVKIRQPVVNSKSVRETVIRSHDSSCSCGCILWSADRDHEDRKAVTWTDEDMDVDIESV